MPRAVAIVPHTHWDREWYSPFQTFRLRLVDLLDELLPAMERDPAYAHFLLDGQMAVVDDYLAVRPEAAARIRRLAGAGRLAMGPWYILMDEFLVSGETMVRNLQLGLDRAAAFGGAMEVGYLPDMFGHVGQMPQLLRAAGFEHAVVWRGVPSSVTGTAFWWEAPDGSRVRAEYLPYGYGNGAAVPDDAKALLRRIVAHEEELGDRLAPGDAILWMNGTDHQEPQRWLGRVVTEVNQIQDDYHLVVTPLADHLAGAPTDGLTTVRGELRSGARANLLMGVTSNRVDVRRAVAAAERAVERRAEPLSALFLPPERWPGALLDEAWLNLVRNSAHDSVCACSVDDVCDAVLVRYAEARQIGDGLAGRAVQALGRSLATEGLTVVNAAARPRSGAVEVLVPGEGPVEGAQVLLERPATAMEITLQGRELGAVLAQVRSQELEPGLFVNDVELDSSGTDVEITLHAGPRLLEHVDVEAVKRELYTLAGARPDRRFHIRAVQRPARRVVARVTGVPGLGWQRWTPAPLDCEPVTAGVAAGVPSLANGLVTVEVDPTAGTFAVDGLAGFDRLVDGGDVGDTYNYSPPYHDEEVDAPVDVEVEVVEAGPVRGRLRVRRRYQWPAAADGLERRADERRAVEVTTTLELRAGERLVRVTAELDNVVRDHRLRTHLPLPARADRSRAECAFATVERGTAAEGGPSERALPTYPARRFVQAGGLTVVHDGVFEYELTDVDDAGTAGQIAVTLLRATAMLSRVEMAYRPLPAGPPIPIDGSQVPGRHVIRYGIAVGDDIDPWALADDAFLPLEVVRSPGGGHAADRGAGLTVTGVEVSSVRRVAGGLEVRMFNPRDRATTVAIEGRSGWLVDLRGRPLEPFESTFELGPWGIATALLP